MTQDTDKKSLVWLRRAAQRCGTRYDSEELDCFLVVPNAARVGVRDWEPPRESSMVWPKMVTGRLQSSMDAAVAIRLATIGIKACQILLARSCGAMTKLVEPSYRYEGVRDF